MKLNSSRARSFAETRWGTGGTSSYRTNRKGAYYFSCSGHGGYVVDGEALTAEERAKIDPYVQPELCFYAERSSTGQCYFLFNPSSVRGRRYRVYGDTVTGKAPIYFFEEDCDWSVLEKFTDIRSKGLLDPEGHEAVIEQCFHSWCAPRVKSA